MHLAEPAANVYARMADAHGITASAVGIERALAARIAERELPEGVPIDQVPSFERESWRGVIRDVVGAEAAEGVYFDALFEHYGRSDAWRRADGVASALTALRARGWRVALVSNMDARLPGILRGLGLAELFDATLFPAKHGLVKPDPRIFAAALEALGSVPENSVYVGDREQDCLEGARRAGLRVLRYAPKGDLKDPETLPGWASLATRL